MRSAAFRVLNSRATPFVALLVFMLLLSYRVLPWNGGLLDYSDGAYVWPTGGFDFISTWNWSNTGFPFIAQSFTSFQYLPNAATQFLLAIGSNGDAYHAYVLYYGSLYACCLIAFFMARDMSGSTVCGYFAATFLVLNNFMLEQLYVWPVTYFYCLTGVLAQLYILWKINEEGASAAKVAASILVSLLPHHPFLSVIHFSLQASFLAYLAVRRKVKVFTALLMLGGSVLIQSYWVAPFLYNLATSSVAETNRASGESAFSGYKYTITYRTILNWINYPMALDPRIAGAVHDYAQVLFNYSFLALVVAALIVALRRSVSRRPEILFFLGLFLLYLNLALGPNSEITGPLWSWAYVHVPGFGYFRSFNRFEVMALLSIIALGALLFRAIDWPFKTATVVLLMVANFAAYHVMFSGTFGGLVTAARVPPEYYQARDRYFCVNRGQVILSLPHIPYESYTWALNDKYDLTNPAMYFMSYFMNAPVIFNQYANMLDRQLPRYADVLRFYYEARPFRESDHELIRELGITHIIVHKDRVDTLKKSAQAIPVEWYIDNLLSSGRYTLLDNNRYFALLELKHPQPLVSGDGVSFNAVTQTKYDVVVHHLKAPIDLKFAQGFHPGWKVYPGSGRAEPIQNGISKNRYFPGDIRYLFEKPVLGETDHHETDGFANSWTLDPEKLRRVLPRGSYRSNADGSLDVRLRLYFQPQAFLMLGITISLVVAAACLIGIAIARLGMFRAGARPRLQLHGI